MRYRTLNIVATIGILISFMITMFVNIDTIQLAFIAILCIFFVVLIANVLLNRNKSHLDGLLFYNLGTNKKSVDADGGIDIED